MDHYSQVLQNPYLPIIFATGGILFLLLSVLQKAGMQIEIKPGKDRFRIFIGFALLLSSAYLYLRHQSLDVIPQGSVESIHITGIRFSSSCLDSDDNLLQIHSYLIKWEVSKGRSYLESNEFFNTPDQDIESGLKEIKGLPWTLNVVENNSLGIYLVRSDGSYADYIGINFIYK